MIAPALAAVLFGVDHAPPFGLAVMLALLVAATLLDLGPARVPAEADIHPQGSLEQLAYSNETSLSVIVK